MNGSLHLLSEWDAGAAELLSSVHCGVEVTPCVAHSAHPRHPCEICHITEKNIWYLAKQYFSCDWSNNAGTLPWYKQTRFFFLLEKKEEVFLSQRKEKKMFCNHTKKGLWRYDAMIICYKMNPSGRKQIGTGNPE